MYPQNRHSPYDDGTLNPDDWNKADFCFTVSKDRPCVDQCVQYFFGVDPGHYTFPLADCVDWAWATESACKEACTLTARLSSGRILDIYLPRLFALFLLPLSSNDLVRTLCPTTF